jgi:hypothetical protein
MAGPVALSIATKSRKDRRSKRTSGKGLGTNDLAGIDLREIKA